jgi:Membrane bound O-acyl transferase family
MVPLISISPIKKATQPFVAPSPAETKWAGWEFLLVLPAAAIAIRPFLAPWVFMWTLSAAIFFGCKWQAWWDQRMIGDATIGRNLGFLFAWPGMDAAAFLDRSRTPQPPQAKEWLWSFTKTALGALLLWGAVRLIPASRDLLAGWTGMVAMILILHFGIFHVASLIWRSAGVDAPAIMQAPLSATSLSDFWGRRWNLGFRQLTHRLVFQPARARFGAPAALLLSFFASGLIHELVISLPARGGYGLPTLYFVAQGIGVLFERSMLGRQLGIGFGIRGWCFAAVCAGAPAFLLFHPVFVHVVILPFLSAIGAR